MSLITQSLGDDIISIDCVYMHLTKLFREIK